MKITQKQIAALHRLVPGADFTVDYSKDKNGRMLWRDARPRPSKAAVDAEVLSIESEEASEKTAKQQLRQRMRDYFQNSAPNQSESVQAIKDVLKFLALENN